MNLKKFFLPVLALGLGAAGVVGAATIVGQVAFAEGKDSSATPENNNVKHHTVVQTRTEAKDTAGYDIVLPENVPDGMVLRNYLVSGIKDSADKAVGVDQHWEAPGADDQRWLIVTQGPASLGLMEGESTTVSRVDGEIATYPVETGRDYEVVALFWPNGDGHLGVVGSITGDQTEASIRQVATSLISP